MKPNRIILAVMLAGLLAYVANTYWPRTITEESLSRQLKGDHCRFAYEIDQCSQRGFEPLRSLLTEEHDCDMWAIQCLSEFKSPEAVEVMHWVLTQKSDVETCDGARPVRSYAVKYLGENGDPSSIPVLQKLIQSNPIAKLSIGARGCSPKPESLADIRAAILKLQEQ